MPNAIDAFIKGQEDLKAAKDKLAAEQANRKPDDSVVPSALEAIEDVLGSAAEIINLKGMLQGTDSFFHRLADNLAARSPADRVTDLGKTVGDKITNIGETVGNAVSGAADVATEVGSVVIKGVSDTAAKVSDAIHRD